MWQAFQDGIFVLKEHSLIVVGAITLLALIYSANLYTNYKLARREAEYQLNFSFFLLLAFFLLSIILRLAYIRDLYVPPYFDSVEHLRIIKLLVAGLNSSALFDHIPNLTQHYYHIGFHLLASLLTFILRADPINVILVFGQIILSAIPIPIFFLVWHKTKNHAASLFALILAGFGWYMPAYAINWGKYPAIAGLLAFEILLGLAYTLSLKKAHHNKFLSAFILILGALFSTLLHSRTLVILAVAFPSWFLAKKANNLPATYKRKIINIQLSILFILGISIQSDPLLKLALEPYLNESILAIITILFLSPFAFRKFPVGVYFSLFFTLGIFSCLFIPVEQILPAFAQQTLLDRPFVEMLIYLPLSILGGLGLAGLLETLKEKRFIFSKQVSLFARATIALMIIGIISFFSLKQYNFYPSACCNFLKSNDTVIFDWVEKNLPPDTHILVAANELSVVPSATGSSLVGSDAGIWLHELTKRKITLMPYSIDFLSPKIIRKLCQKEISYIYIGNNEESFNGSQLNKEREWYKTILFLPEAQLYQLISCSGIN